MSEILLNTPSTQLVLKERLFQNQALENFYWVQALEQSGGRGRQDKIWVSPKGNLYLSLLLRGPVNDVTWVPHRVALCIHETILFFGLTPEFLKIKWPNDIVWCNPARSSPYEKLAGILVEKLGDHLLIGVGLNVNALPLVKDQPVTTLSQLLSKPIDLEAVKNRLLQNIKIEFSPQSKPNTQKYSTLQFFKVGQKIKWNEQAGEFLRIGNFGEMIVKTSNGVEVPLFSEEVSLKF